MEDELIDDQIDGEGEGHEEQPKPEAKDGKSGEGAGDEKIDVRSVMRELKELKSSIVERDRALEYWRGRAEGSGKKDAPAEGEDEEEEISLQEDLVDAISSNDAKRVASALKQMGFVREKDVQKAIQSTRQSITRDAELLRKYPDLGDEQSEFFQTATKHFKELCADDPRAANDPRSLKTAARMAELELRHAGSAEESRTERIRRQSGERGARPSKDSGNDALSPTQRRIIENLRAAGAHIDEDGYRRRASSGVKMSGIRRGR